MLAIAIDISNGYHKSNQFELTTRSLNARKKINQKNALEQQEKEFFG